MTTDEAYRRSEELLRSDGWSTDPDALIRALRIGDVAVRSEAAFMLGRDASPPAQQALAVALGDEEARVRVEAATSLLGTGLHAEACRTLREETHGPFFEGAPLRAAAALAAADDLSGYARIRAALISTDAAERFEGAGALYAFVDHDGVEAADGEVVDIRTDVAQVIDDPEPLVAEVAAALRRLIEEAVS